MSEKNKENEKKNEKNIQIDISKEVALGQYSNLALSNYNKEEVIVDFAFIQPHGNKGEITSRVIMSPRNAKRLAEMLLKNVKDYEKKVGPLSDSQGFPGINLSVN
jgi:hypothetical protein